jgi:hypothetical protein
MLPKIGVACNGRVIAPHPSPPLSDCSCSIDTGASVPAVCQIFGRI